MMVVYSYDTFYAFLLFRYASEARDGSTYFTLLIITDGEITDMQQTKNAIVMVTWFMLSVDIKLPSIIFAKVC